MIFGRNSLFTCCLVLSLVVQAQDVPPPPSKSACDTPQHKQFDFWLGNWQVSNKEGQLLGTNKVVSILDGCVVSENWQAANGDFSGKSYNFYDSQLKQWHQTWIDNKGGVLYLDGQLEGNVMVLQGQRLAKDGSTTLHKISYTPLPYDKVKQRWQSSKDNGQTWADLFVGYYKK
ncbi:hypothetical protein [Paraglaciecola aestuariivivens]